jgi:lactate dehydrogenase-like 2-hydroxyacid dehydrogenase
MSATKRNILITNTPGVLTEATADLTWALIFSTARRISESERFTRKGEFRGWGPMLFLGMDITGKTLGVIGTGRIGTAVAMRSRGFNMRVLYTDIKPNDIMEKTLKAKKVDLGTLLKESDFVSLHVPLIPETTHLIGKLELGLMKKTAILINTSRGPVVHEEALATALKQGDIAGAGLDVYEEEPKIHHGLMELDNVILLPHIGSATITARTKMAVMAAENLLAGLKGERPPNIVNPTVME